MGPLSWGSGLSWAPCGWALGITSGAPGTGAWPWAVGLPRGGPEQESPMGRCEVWAWPASPEGELPAPSRGSQWSGWHRADPPHLDLAPRSQKGAGVLPSV